MASVDRQAPTKNSTYSQLRHESSTSGNHCEAGSEMSMRRSATDHAYLGASIVMVCPSWTAMVVHLSPTALILQRKHEYETGIIRLHCDRTDTLLGHVAAAPSLHNNTGTAPFARCLLNRSAQEQRATREIAGCMSGVHESGGHLDTAQSGRTDLLDAAASGNAC